MNLKRSIIAIVAAAPLIALLSWGITRDPNYIPSPLPGKDVPAFSLEVFAAGQPPLDRAPGDSLSADELKGNLMVVNFWASWCLACREEHAALSETAMSYAGRPVQFIGVLYQDKQEPALEWIKRMGGQSYPSVDDPNSHTAIAFGLYGVPETFIVDRYGKVAHKEVGPVTRGLLTRILDSLLVGMEAERSTQGEGR